MSHARQGIRWKMLACAGWLLAGGGCGFAGMDAELFDSSGNTCSRNSQCPSGATCVAGMCATAVGDVPLEVGFTVSPNAVGTTISGPTSASFPLRAIAESGEIRLSVPAAVEVYGQVTAGGEKVPADLHFMPRHVIPELRGRGLDVTTSAERASFQGVDVDYRVRLLRDVTYDIHIEPKGARAAELTPRRVRWKPTEEGSHLRFDVDLSEDAATARTEVLRITNLPPDIRMRLRAVDPATGTLASTVHFLEGSTDAEVTLRLLPGMAAYEVRLVPVAPEREGVPGYEVPVFPSFMILLDDLPRIEGGMRQLPLPDVPEKVIRYRTHVELCDGTQGETMPHLSVAVRSTNLGFETFQHLRAVYNRTVMAVAQEGEPYPVLDVHVVPGDYEVAVRPPSDSPCGVLIQQVTPVENGQSLVLEPASVITGRLYREDRASGERVGIAGASLDASALADAEVGMHHRSSQAMTDADGFFTLFVDRGRYDVVAKPVLGMGFGWQLLHDVEIASQTCGLHEDPDRDDCVVLHTEIRLDAPIPVSGQLRFEGALDGGPTSWGPSGATVTAYVMTDNDDEDGRPVPIATATSDAEGRFRMLLSPSIRRGLF